MSQALPLAFGRMPEFARQNSAVGRTEEDREAARLALEVVEALPDVEGRSIYSGVLNRALDPLRSSPALEVLCGRNGDCSKRLAWWALDSTYAFVVATQRLRKRSERRGGISDLAVPNPREREGILPWIELADGGETTVRTVDVKTTGFPIRLKFVCTCGADYTTTNTVRLKAFLRGKQTIGPAVLARDL
jgi:hypothetical protein